MQDRAPRPTDRSSWALFLDIDGTLLDLAPAPDAVVVPGTLPPLLDALTRLLSGAVALISGRSLDGIDRLFPGGGDAAGTHGVESRLGGVVTAPATPWPDSLTHAVEAAAARLPGVVVERKSHSVALHYLAAPEQAAAVRALAEAIRRDSALPLTLLDGKAVVEILPAGAGKGAAIERFMRGPPYAGRMPVFVGDDVTDESGFAVVNRMGGISIHIGESPNTAARYRFPSPDSLRNWLADLDRSLGGGSANGHA